MFVMVVALSTELDTETNRFVLSDFLSMESKV